MNQTLAERKRKERQEKLERIRRRQKRQFIGFLIAFVLIIVLAIYFLNSDYFKVKAISFEGTSHLAKENLEKIKNMFTGKNIFRVPVKDAKEILSSSPWVKEVEIHRDFPDKINVKVIEREPVASITDGIQYFLVSDDGMVLEVSDSAPELIQIADLPVRKLKPGDEVKTEEFNEAMEIYTGLPSSLKKKVSVISAPSLERIILYISGVEVLYGMAEHLEEKNAVLEQILKKEGTSVISIDIRVPTNPVVKSQP